MRVRKPDVVLDPPVEHAAVIVERIESDGRGLTSSLTPTPFPSMTRATWAWGRISARGR